MAASVLTSLDTLLKSARDNGLWDRFLAFQTPATQATPTTTSGHVTCGRVPVAIAAPSVGAGLTGMYLTVCKAVTNTSAFTYVCLEYALGTLTIGATRPADVFAAGVSMPTKNVRGASVQTSSQLSFAYVSTAITGTVTLTITYTNQDGIGSRTATLGPLQASPVLSTAYPLQPYLQAGDTGIRSVQGIATNAGTAGQFIVTGTLMLGLGADATAGQAGGLDMLDAPFPIFLIEPTDTIGVYRLFTSASTFVYLHLAGVAENS